MKTLAAAALRRRPFAGVLLLWLFFAFWQVGYDSPDEHFPTLERAGGLLFNGWWDESWDWRDGLRSHWPALFLAVWLWPWVHLLGIEDRIWLDAIARGLHVLGAALSYWSVGRIARANLPRLSVRELEKIQVWSLVQFPLVVWGTRHGLDTFAIPLMLLGFALLFEAKSPERKWMPAAVLSGLCMGLAFVLRFTLALPMGLGVIAACYFLGLRELRSFSKFLGVWVVFFFGAVALLSGVDAWLYQFRAQPAGASGWVIPLWNFFRFNILGGSGGFHASPWWELWAYAAVLISPVFGYVAWFRPKGWTHSLPWGAFVILGSLFVFSFVRHKEMRMIFPLLAFAPLAIVPLLPRAWERVAFVWNGFLLLVLAVLYSEPHGAYVRGLNAAARLATQAGIPRLTVEGVGGAAQFPKFYMRPEVNPVRIAPDRPVPKELTPLLILGRGILRPECVLVHRFEPSLFHKLRESVRSSSPPEGVWRCD